MQGLGPEKMCHLSSVGGGAGCREQRGLPASISALLS
jgi:hypothetical protein